MNMGKPIYFTGKQIPMLEVMLFRVDKAFYKPTDDSFGRSIVGKEGKSISRVSVYFSKNK